MYETFEQVTYFAYSLKDGDGCPEVANMKDR